MNPDVYWNIVIDKQTKTLSVMMSKGCPAANAKFLQDKFGLTSTECNNRFGTCDVTIMGGHNPPDISFSLEMIPKKYRKFQIVKQL